jgi:hypothetical protein
MDLIQILGLRIYYIAWIDNRLNISESDDKTSPKLSISELGHDVEVDKLTELNFLFALDN